MYNPQLFCVRNNQCVLSIAHQQSAVAERRDGHPQVGVANQRDRERLCERPQAVRDAVDARGAALARRQRRSEQLVRSQVLAVQLFCAIAYVPGVSVSNDGTGSGRAGNAALRLRSVRTPRRRRCRCLDGLGADDPRPAQVRIAAADQEPRSSGISASCVAACREESGQGLAVTRACKARLCPHDVKSDRACWHVLQPPLCGPYLGALPVACSGFTSAPLPSYAAGTVSREPRQ